MCQDLEKKRNADNSYSNSDPVQVLLCARQCNKHYLI